MVFYNGFAFILLLSASRAWIFPRRLTRFPHGTPEDSVHNYFMKRALDQARTAGKSGEVPIGALIIRNETSSQQDDQVYRILAAGANRVETLSDASAHAELICLRRAAAREKNWRLLECTLYTTLEPCAMCLSAALAFRISTIVYGAPDLRLGAIVTHQQLLHQPHPFHNVSTVVSGVLAEESAKLLKEFFRQRRQQQAANKVKRPPSERIFFWRLQK